ncbi:TasA family protein [Mesobacillus jeotgali]|uniref:TasA family protein n=1 Tax=Mesobacillus jeotgali TaxID=129985 RepID=UPI000C83CFC8|nr:TasA family protein [Mesobacillus jeotgali]
MSIKKKMGIGILAGALGVSLIGGGTWAAFNDVETLDNSFNAGTLDLTTNPQTELFNLSNLKPGDHFTKTITLGNNGSLAIDDIFLTTEVSDWVDKTHDHLPLSANGFEDGKNSEEEFLKQFKVTVKRGTDVVYDGDAFGLSNLTNSEISGSNASAAIIPGGSMQFEVYVEFKNDPTSYIGSRLQEQNKFQDEGASISLKFEGTQMPGEDK